MINLFLSERKTPLRSAAGAALLSDGGAQALGDEGDDAAGDGDGFFDVAGVGEVAGDVERDGTDRRRRAAVSGDIAAHRGKEDRQR